MKAQVGAIVLMMAVTVTLGNGCANRENIERENMEQENMEQECPTIISTGDERLTHLLSLAASVAAGINQAKASGNDAEAEKLYRVFLQVEDDVYALQEKSIGCQTYADEGDLRAIRKTSEATATLRALIP